MLHEVPGSTGIKRLRDANGSPARGPGKMLSGRYVDRLNGMKGPMDVWNEKADSTGMKVVLGAVYLFFIYAVILWWIVAKVAGDD